MIVVKVELHSAITHRVTELARMVIANKGDEPNPKIGNYDVTTIRGRSTEALDEMTSQRKGEVLGHRRLDEHVWFLVGKALKAVKYA
jgi:hypothetical protein